MLLSQLRFSPKLVQARWVFNMLPSEDAPVLAQEALQQGYDGKCVRRMAGLIGPDIWDVEPLMAGFLAELGASAPLSQEEAAMEIARSVAEAIITGAVKPYDGARFISREIAEEAWPNPPSELVSFVDNASEYEDFADFYKDPDEVRRNIEQSIVEHARKLARTR